MTESGRAESGRFEDDRPEGHRPEDGGRAYAGAHVDGAAEPSRGQAQTGDPASLAARFEAHRPHLRAVAYRMLGSLAEADDAVQEAWFKASRSDTARVGNLGGWLTTVVGRVCLDMLRSRKSRREEPLEESGLRMPQPVVGPVTGADPEQAALLADSVGLALLVVLENLAPAERLAFVLHDLFGVPFDEIAPLVGRTPAAARQLASRARRRVQGGAPAPDADLARQRAVVDAFLSAAREGDFAALVDVLDPDVVARSEAGVTAGAASVAAGASSFARLARLSRPVLVNGTVGMAAVDGDRFVSVIAFTIVNGRIAVMDIVANPDLLADLDVRVLDR
ncbi:sigma-70 family RNA polymerase sigma factor [Streptomyces sp. NPDC059785]|uniref:sigma-70 family RNA polymerase sigma factor n=1 Tax=Streptomyces sp. NPDC059785 TaxID=3346945 RepID=UPI00364C02D3